MKNIGIVYCEAMIDIFSFSYGKPAINPRGDKYYKALREISYIVFLLAKNDILPFYITVLRHNFYFNR